MRRGCMAATIVLRSVGQVKLPLFVSIGAFFVNLLANYMFIFGKFGAPRMEVAGAALGTLIARLFEAGMILISSFAPNCKEENLLVNEIGCIIIFSLYKIANYSI